MTNVIFQLKEEVFNIEKVISEAEQKIVRFWPKPNVIRFYRKVIIRQEELLIEYKAAINILNNESI